MQFADRLNVVQPSMTLSINTRAQELRSQGIEVISVAVGEPDFPTPDYIKQAAIRAIEGNFTKYTPVAGIPELRRAAGNYFEKNYQVPVAPESIIIGAGGKQCLYTFMQAYLNPGDEVLVPAPYWVSYPDMAMLAGAKPIYVPTDATLSFKVNPALLESQCTSRTRLLILNSPCNPTGMVYSPRELGEIMEWAIAGKIFVLSDEIYDQLVYAPARMTSAITWFPKYPELVAVANGLSKSYAMTGWRVGYLAGHPELIKKMTILQGHMTSNVSSISQKAALAALEGPDQCVREMRDSFEERRNLALAIISSWKKAICPGPDGAFYLFIDISGYYTHQISDSVALCQYLLEKAHVAAVPGAAFGDDRCIRLSYAIGKDTLKNALEAIGNALQTLPA